MATASPSDLMGMARAVVGNREPRLALRDTHLGHEGALALAEALSANTVLEDLDLYGCALGDVGAEALARALCAHGQCTAVDLGANELGTLEALAPLLHAEQQAGWLRPHASSGILHLRLARNRLEGGACGALLSAAAPAARAPALSLQSLALSFNPIGEEGAAHLGEALQRSPNLRTLQLHSCQLGAAGGAALAPALRDARALGHLDLSGNDLGDEGAKAIARHLPHARAIAELLLSHNRIGADGACGLAFALVRRAKCTLRALVLRGNPLGDAGAASLAESIGAPPPRGNRSLATLDLGGCRISTEGALAIGDALVANGALAHLALDGNERIDAPTRNAIAHLLGLNASNREMPPPAVAPNAEARRHVRVDVQQLYTDAGAPPPRTQGAALDARAERWAASVEALAEAQEELTIAAAEVDALRHKVSALEDVTTGAEVRF